MRGVTSYQLEMLRLVLAGNPEGVGRLDFDQMLERLSWHPSKQAAQFSIRALVSKGVLEKKGQEVRRGRCRVTFGVTDSGMRLLDPREHVPTKTTFVPGIDDADPFLELEKLL